MIRTPPLSSRNRLAALILRALHDEAARAELERLAEGREGEGWLEGHGAEEVAALRNRVRAAREALAVVPLRADDGSLAGALDEAAILFDAGLHFEVHERLEPLWQVATGDTRETLQGLVQVAVGYQHAANGNLAGARALLQEGGARLHGRRLAGIDLDGFARAVVESVPLLAALPASAIPRLPRR